MPPDNGGMTVGYHSQLAHLSLLAIFLFAMAVYFMELKYLLRMLPGFEQFSVLQGVFALSLFFFYLCTIWYFAYPVYTVLFQTGISRQSFIRSNCRLNLPILFPWAVFSLAYDLISLSPWAWTNDLLNRMEGQIAFFAVFLIGLMVFMPKVIQYWWGCKPLENWEKAGQLKAFLREKGFQYRQLLKWPIFEGRLMTAGIMGIVPRYRYILITDSLLETLSIEELKAVMAHEMGHAKYRHLFSYILFFIGFMVLSFGLYDLFFYFFYTCPFFMKIIPSGGPQTVSFSYLILSLPMLLALIVYFRYIMGFFMRNFERQADLYSTIVMGTPKPIISSLEKIAYFSGKSRDVPSWHHFSIRQRVACLQRTLKEPGLIRRHNRFLAISFSIYLVCLVGLGYFLNFSPMKQDLPYLFAAKIITRQIVSGPENIDLYQDLAAVYHHLGKYEEAVKAYEKGIDLDPDQPILLNNLAWILATSTNEELRDEGRALDLAKKAVSLSKSSVFLDTLAEAYYANGLTREAVEAIQEAIGIATENKGYYEKQLNKFLNGT